MYSKKPPPPLTTTPLDDDDFIATLLASEARERSIKYSVYGLSALLPDKRPPANAPKPNTRFLRNIVREVDSHNAALLAREAEEAKARLKDLKEKERRDRRDKKEDRRQVMEDEDGKGSEWVGGKEREGGREKDKRTSRGEKSEGMEDGDNRRKRRKRGRSKSRSPSRSRCRSISIDGEDNNREESRWRKRKDRQRDQSQSPRRKHRDWSNDRKSKDREKERKHHHHHSHRHNRTHRSISRSCRRHRDHSGSRSRSISRSRSRSRSRSSGKEKARSRESKPEDKRHWRGSRERQRERRRSAHTSPSPSTSSPKLKDSTPHSSLIKRILDTEHPETEESYSSSDQSSVFIGPKLPKPPAPRVRGRGANKLASGSSAMDARFNNSSSSLHHHELDKTPTSASNHLPSPDHGDDDWNSAVQAFRERQRWKAVGAERLRSAGFPEEYVKAWEGDSIKDEAKLKWAEKGAVREWDRGKVVQETGEVTIKAPW